MAKHIVDLITDEKAHHRASQEAREDQENLTWDRAASKLIEQYRSLMDSY